MKTRLHQQNQKYLTYRNAIKGGPSHGRSQHAGEFGEVWQRGFPVIRADSQTDIIHNTLCPSRGRTKDTLYFIGLGVCQKLRT